LARYAIGDVQGCHDELEALLSAIDFDPALDQIWLTGDLVNRGPKSLATLRTLKALGPAVIAVLGNHDLHLLAVAEGISRTKHRDTFRDVLEAPDRGELLSWLRHLPLMVAQDGWHLVHAGLPPQWSTEHALHLAKEVETVLQGPSYEDFLWHMYGDQPDMWDEDLKSFDRLRFITNCLTRLRFCSPEGRILLKEKGEPHPHRKDLIPWFMHPDRQSQNQWILFGHWSTLGFHQSHQTICLDTGCLWGGSLTALHLDGSFETTSISCLKGAYQSPDLSD